MTHKQPLRGERIPGSVFVRDFCDGCGESIRVVSIHVTNFCQDCVGHEDLQMKATHSRPESVQKKMMQIEDEQ